MRAKQLIEGAAFGPESLKVIGQAFDDAWARLAPRYGGDATAVEAARLRLAETVLRLAETHGSNVSTLSEAALAAMDKRT